MNDQTSPTHDLRKKWKLLQEKRTSLEKVSIGKFFDQKIYSVNGEAVRNVYSAEFYFGGHHKVYKYVPNGEIWLENCFKKKEMHFFVAHETIEWFLMKHKNYTYDNAHDIANHYETRLRDGVKPEKVFADYLNKYYSKKVVEESLDEFVRCYKSFQ